MKEKQFLKQVLAAIFMVLLTNGLVGATETELKELELATEITAVTVYFDHALVTREANVNLRAGLQDFIIKHLPGEIDENLLQVIPPEGSKLQSLNIEKTFLTREPEEKIRRLEDQVQGLRDQIREQDDLLNIYRSEKSFITSIQVSSPEKMSAELSLDQIKSPDVNAYRQTLDFLTSSLIDTASKVREAEARKRELQPQLRVKEKELAEAKVISKLEEKEVVISLESDKPVHGKITLSYLLPGAMWFPVYDIRSNLDKGIVELDYYGVIQQSTGEDWEAVSITLAGIRPSNRATKPELSPWYLSYGQPIATESQRSVEQLMLTPQITAQYEQRPQGYKKAHSNLLLNAAQVQRVFAAIKSRGTSISFPTIKQETIKADGKPYRTKVGSYSLKVKVAYSTIPRLSLSTYVTGKGKNTSPYPLLPGNASLFRQGCLLGKTSIGFIAPNEKAELYLGVDESIKAVRELDYHKSESSFFGKRKYLEFSYDIIIENFKEESVAVSVHDCVPVSQDSKIKTDIDEIAPVPDKVDKGLLTWDISVPPGGKKKIHYIFYIEYPKDMPPPLTIEHEKLLQKR